MGVLYAVNMSTCLASISLPVITAKDERDIHYLENDVDFIALSFVRSPDDVAQLRI